MKRISPVIALISIIGLTATVVAQEAPKPHPTAAKRTPQQAPPPPADGGARIEVNPSEFDFGEVWQNNPVTSSIEIKNVGTEPLTIAARSSCGCTVATTPKSPLAPGETTTFSITYDTKRAGKAHKRVTLTTNDPTNPSVAIPVKGTVKSIVKATPRDRILFTALKTDSAESQTLTLENELDRPLKLRLRDGQDFGPFRVELKEIEAGRKYELTATTVPPLAPGRTNGQIIVETGVEEAPTLQFRMYAHVPPRVAISPPRVYLYPTMQVPSERVLRLRFPRGEPVEIREIKTSSDKISCEVTPLPEGIKPSQLMMRELRVALPAYADLPDDGATIELTTNVQDPAYQHLVVDVLKQQQRAGTAVRRLSPDEVKEKVGSDEMKKRLQEAIDRVEGDKAKDADTDADADEETEGAAAAANAASE
jgi:hypothetical protein